MWLEPDSLHFCMLESTSSERVVKKWILCQFPKRAHKRRKMRDQPYKCHAKG